MPAGDKSDGEGAGQTREGVGHSSGRFPGLTLWWEGRERSQWSGLLSQGRGPLEPPGPGRLGPLSRQRVHLAGPSALAVWGPAPEPEASCVSERRFSLCHGPGTDCARNWWRARWGSSSRAGRRAQRTAWGNRVRPPGCQEAAKRDALSQPMAGDGAGFSPAVVSEGPCAVLPIVGAAQPLGRRWPVYCSRRCTRRVGSVPRHRLPSSALPSPSRLGVGSRGPPRPQSLPHLQPRDPGQAMCPEAAPLLGAWLSLPATGAFQGAGSLAWGHWCGGGRAANGPKSWATLVLPGAAGCPLVAPDGSCRCCPGRESLHLLPRPSHFSASGEQGTEYGSLGPQRPGPGEGQRCPHHLPRPAVDRLLS